MKLDTAKDRNVKRKSEARGYYCALWLARRAAMLYHWTIQKEAMEPK